MWSVPYESSVAVTQPILVGYCALCELVYEPYTKGETCLNDHEWEMWAYKRYGNGEARGLVKRLMWKCSVCDHYYLTRRGLLNHEHEWYI